MKVQGSVRALGLVGMAMIVMAGAACVATATPVPERGVVVSGPPPQPISESRTAPPGANAAWVEGYWHWTGAQYSWIPGHWESAPPGSRWYAPRYVSADGAYFYEPGGWQAQGPAAAPQRVPPAPEPRASSLR
jgi:WXXGXW repeat (2 copies)